MTTANRNIIFIAMNKRYNTTSKCMGDKRKKRQDKNSWRKEY